MRGSLQLGVVAGIPVKLHWSFALLFVWVVFVGVSEGMDFTGILWFCIFTIALFACVVMHEFGHALTARKYGVSTRDIILSPIGGIARLAKFPENAIHELLIALAGPAVNVVISIVLGTILIFSTEKGLNVSGEANEVFNNISNFFPLLVWLNITLAIFNMIPAFPMDGGRVLRALLATSMSRVKATKWASRTGQVLAVGFMIWAIWQGHVILGLIALFVYFSAGAEYRHVVYSEQLGEYLVSDIMQSFPTPLQSWVPMRDAVQKYRQGDARHFVVFGAFDEPVGILYLSDLNEAIEQNTLDQPVSNFAHKNAVIVSPEDSLKKLSTVLSEREVPAALVRKNGQIIGLVDQKSLGSVRKSQGREQSGSRIGAGS